LVCWTQSPMAGWTAGSPGHSCLMNFNVWSVRWTKAGRALTKEWLVSVSFWKRRTFPLKASSTDSKTSLLSPALPQNPAPISGSPPWERPQSILAAASNGFNLMLVPFAATQTQGIVAMYRDAWKEAGHPGQGKIALGFHMYCHQDREEANRIAEPNVNRYLRSLAGASVQDAAWGAGTSSKDYPGY